MSKVQMLSLEELLKKDKVLLRPFQGVSMLPMLEQKFDIVRLIEPVKEPARGDVVLYKNSEKKYTLHRITGVEKQAYLIRGDNCIRTEYVKKDRIIAVMEGFFKNGVYIPIKDEAYQRYVQEVLLAGRPLLLPEWRYLVRLFSAAFSDGKVPLPPAYISFTRLYRLCTSQRITAVVARSIKKLPEGVVPVPVLEAFSKASDNALRREMLFTVEREKLYEKLEKENIPYLPLKGILFKDLYPYSGMREFADHDILYDECRQKELISVMTELGFSTENLHSNHDIFHKQPIFNFELHKTLFSEESPYFDEFSDILSRAEKDPESTCRYHMKPEDFYLYCLCHLEKHYTASGCGIRSLADLYLIEKNFVNVPSFDRLYFEKKLSSLSLADFEQKMQERAKELMEKGTLPDEALQDMLSGGVYGSEVVVIKREIKKRGKLRFFCSRLLLPPSSMRTAFPVLRKWPILLPFFEVVRGIQVFIKPDRRKNLKLTLSLLFQKKKE